MLGGPEGRTHLFGGLSRIASTVLRRRPFILNACKNVTSCEGSSGFFQTPPHVSIVCWPSNNDSARSSRWFSGWPVPTFRLKRFSKLERSCRSSLLDAFDKNHRESARAHASSDSSMQTLTYAALRRGKCGSFRLADRTLPASTLKAEPLQ